MLDLANKIRNITNKDVKVNFEKNKDSEYLVDNPSRRCPSIDKARSLLKFNPKIDLDEGLRRTRDYYASNFGGKNL
ncbi:MAG: NAD-dependent dehydratase, partial [Pseudomonadota bacterium]|nr:NAD-dependent dehydratase [Pseudomonadota bacterium]